MSLYISMLSKQTRKHPLFPRRLGGSSF